MVTTMPFLAILLGTAILLAAPPAHARDLRELLSLGQNTGIRVDAAVPRPGAYSQAEEPPWLMKALTRQHPKRHAPAQRLVFRRAGKPTYAAAVWTGEWPANSKFVLYRIAAASQPHLQPVLELAEHRLAIVEPSGQDVHGDRTPVLFLEQGSGGSGYEGYRLHIFRLEDEVRDVTPPLRTVWAEDIDGDGVVEVASSDDRWANFFHGCGQCGPLIPVISMWRDGAYRPACRDKPEFIAESIAILKKWLQEPEQMLLGEFEATAWEEIALLHLQAGHSAEAKAVHEEFLGLLSRARGEAQTESRAKTLAIIEARARQGISPVIDKGETFATAQCPLLEAEGGGHHGWHDRLRRFGWKGPAQ